MKKAIFWILTALVVGLCAVLIAAAVKCAENKRKEKEKARLVQEYIDNKLALYAEENAQNDGFEVVFLGDSLTDSCDLAKYYAGYITSNRGIGGDTTSGLIDRLAVSAYDAHPQVIVLLIGGNDILGGRSVDTVCANYETIITGIREHLPETEIVWCSMTALGSDWAKHNGTVIACNERIRTLADQYGCLYVDLFTPLCNPETGEIYKAYTAEGVHLTDAGYQVVSAAIKEHLYALLGH